MTSLKNINMQYRGNDFYSLKDVSFEVTEGQIISLIGPNGAGKTTLIKIMSGLLMPTHYDKIDICGSNPYSKKSVKNNIGLILNSNQLYEDLTVKENILYYLVLNKIRKTKEEISVMLKSVGLEKKENILVKELSTGMKQKLNIAKVLLADMQLLILDEPTSGMDPISKSDIYQLLNKIKDEYNTTIIISSHAMNDVEKICDSVIFINEGKIVYNGDLELLTKKFNNEVTEIYCDDNVLNMIKDEFEESGEKYYVSANSNFNKVIVFKKMGNMNIKNYKSITFRPLELEDIFFFYVLGVNKNDKT